MGAGEAAAGRRGRRRKTDAQYRKRIQSLQAVDRSIGKLITTLKNNGQLANTYIVFTSDNGFHLGQHRLPQGKQTAYEEDIHVPLIVRGPGRARRTRRAAHITGNVDYAPTFAALGGAPRRRSWTAARSPRCSARTRRR